MVSEFVREWTQPHAISYSYFVETFNLVLRKGRLLGTFYSPRQITESLFSAGLSRQPLLLALRTVGPLVLCEIAFLLFNETDS